MKKNIIFIGILSLVVTFGGYQYIKLSRELSYTKQSFANQSEELQNAITTLQSKVASTTSENQNLNDLLIILKAHNGDYQNELNAVQQKVAILQKKDEIDPELLQKYSKVYFLNENYIPSQLSLIDSSFLQRSTKPEQIHSQIKPFLENMIRDARSAGVDISVLSAYRSFGTQAQLKSQYTVTYGAGTANKFSADQGYSEHQLGSALDFTTKNGGEILQGFDKTPAYSWLLANAYKYGFILSYPANNSYYVFEPWHWRFVGILLASYLHDNQKKFYDLSQRDIDTYRVHFFDSN